MDKCVKMWILVDKNKNMADYYPNYDAILPSNYKFNGIPVRSEHLCLRFFQSVRLLQELS